MYRRISVSQSLQLAMLFTAFVLAAAKPAFAVSPPVLSISFGAATVKAGDTTTITFSIQNDNATIALTGLAFTDNLPGFHIASPSGLSGSCGNGTITANPWFAASSPG